jgi:hypothetical protein
MLMAHLPKPILVAAAAAVLLVHGVTVMEARVEMVALVLS